MINLPKRPRRNRRTAGIRNLVVETRLVLADLVYPMFVIPGEQQKIGVSSMPGIFRFSLDILIEEVKEVYALGISSIALFPALPDNLKDKTATESTNAEGLYLKAIASIKDACPEIVIISDVAMDPYSSDGHDGYVENGEILNDTTLPILAAMAVAQAKAGADFVAPSDMMDGRIGYIREALDEAGFTNTGIIAYTAKYASALYGPFRDALDSAPKFGDKKTYQMNPANSNEAIIEAELDLEEGADMIMVKPAGMYLDVIKLLADNFSEPIVAYQVSGEYAMIKAASQNGWIDNDKAMIESLLSIKRAGAKVVFTYFAKELALYFKNFNIAYV